MFFSRHRIGGAAAWSAGEHVGPYRIVGVLGVGGMGMVYEATRDGLDQRVALKTLSFLSVADDPDHLQREARILARLSHPGVARVHDVGVHREEQRGATPYVAMELVEGHPITQAAAGMPIPDRVRLLVQVCRAVEHAHQRLVIHRDLKPSNILVDESGRPVVLDFGVAKLLGPDVEQRTLTGQVMGTIAYMSPEQAEGEPDELDTRTDVYSLGVVLYEMLTGALPVDVRSMSLLRAARAIRHQAPTRPSEMIPEIRGDLEIILLKALEKDKDRRCPSPAALADDLERWLRREPIEARPPSAWYRGRMFIRRNLAATIASASAALALIGGATIATHQAIRAGQAEQRATERFNDVRELAQTVIFDLHDAIAGLPGATEARATLVDGVMLYLERLASEAGDDPGFRLELAESYLRLANAQSGYFNANMMRFSEGNTTYIRAVTLFRELDASGFLDPAALRLYRDALRGWSMTQRTVESAHVESRYGVIMSPAKDWLAISDRIIATPEATDADRAAHAEALTHIALILHHLDSERSRITEAFDASEAALELITPTGRLTSHALSVEGDLHQRRGTIFLRWDDPEAAAESFRRSVDILERARALAPEDWLIRRRLAFSLTEGSLALGRLGDPEAEPFALEGVRVMEELVQSDATDRRSLRDIDACCFLAAEGHYQLAMNAPELTLEKRRALLEASLALFREAHRLTEERAARGDLPEWEAHYPQMAEEGIQRAEAALEAI